MDNTLAFDADVDIKQQTIQEVERRLMGYRTKVKELEDFLLILNQPVPSTGKGEILRLHGKTFEGMGTAEAMKTYLLFFAKNRTASLEELLNDLKVGGAALGLPERHVRNIKITCKNNPKVFIYNEDTDVVSLLPVHSIYIEPFPEPRKNKKKKSSTKASPANA
jgi:hypothetical protein